ncbi:GA module-containing protein [Mycoplasma sp. Ms02]|uniref:GA module-containing protein n=1 Tax=Mycoplasma sp. Ms02 TaxID=353851 RepID=UPI001C8AB8A1|nr:GA module-containing protein [Mycoplasma sp. Ms02]QZE12453.1 GA module-containing protein [Mycoplasma sp. Ms02]
MRFWCWRFWATSNIPFLPKFQKNFLIPLSTSVETRFLSYDEAKEFGLGYTWDDQWLFANSNTEKTSTAEKISSNNKSSFTFLRNNGVNSSLYDSRVDQSAIGNVLIMKIFQNERSNTSGQSQKVEFTFKTKINYDSPYLQLTQDQVNSGRKKSIVGVSALGSFLQAGSPDYDYVFTRTLMKTYDKRPIVNFDVSVNHTIKKDKYVDSSTPLFQIQPANERITSLEDAKFGIKLVSKEVGAPDSTFESLSAEIDQKLFENLNKATESEIALNSRFFVTKVSDEEIEKFSKNREWRLQLRGRNLLSNTLEDSRKIISYNVTPVIDQVNKTITFRINWTIKASKEVIWSHLNREFNALEARVEAKTGLNDYAKIRYMQIVKAYREGLRQRTLGTNNTPVDITSENLEEFIQKVKNLDLETTNDSNQTSDTILGSATKALSQAENIKADALNELDVLRQLKDQEIAAYARYTSNPSPQSIVETNALIKDIQSKIEAARNNLNKRIQEIQNIVTQQGLSDSDKREYDLFLTNFQEFLGSNSYAGKDKAIQISDKSENQLKNYLVGSANQNKITLEGEKQGVEDLNNTVSNHQRVLISKAKEYVDNLTNQISSDASLSQEVKDALIKELQGSSSSTDYLEKVTRYEAVLAKLNKLKERAKKVQDIVQKYADHYKTVLYKNDKSGNKELLDGTNGQEGLMKELANLAPYGDSNNKLDNTKYLLNQKGSEMSDTDFESLISNIDKSINGLNGKPIDRNEALNAIRFSELSEAKKQELINKVNESESQDAVDAIKNLDLPKEIAKEFVLKEAEIKVGKEYIFADQNLKATFDAKMQELKNVLAKENATGQEIESTYNAAKNAKDALNGIVKLNEVKQKIANANETLLSQDSKSALTQNVDQTIQNRTELDKLNQALDQYLEKNEQEKANAQSYDAAHSQTIYTNETDSSVKQTYDTNKQNVANQFANANTPALSNADDLINKLSQIQNAVADYKEAYETLDGNRKKLISDIQSFENLTPEQKQALETEVNSLQKTAPASELQVIKEKAFEQAKANIKTKVNELQNLSSQEKSDFARAIDNTKSRDDGAYDANLGIVLDNAKLQDAKNKAKADIEALEHLTPSQKQTFKDNIDKKLSAANIEQELILANEINDLNKKAKDLFNSYSKDQPKYKFASNKEQADALENDLRNYLNDSNQLTKEQLIQKLNNYQEQIDALNGQEVLDNAKADIQSLNDAQKLSDQQTQDFQNKLDNAQNAQKLNEVKDQAQKLTDLKSKLQQAIANAEEAKDSLKYTGETQAVKEGFEQDLINAKEALSKLENLDVNDQSVLNAALEDSERKAELLDFTRENLNGIYEDAKNKLENKFDLLTDYEKAKLKNDLDLIGRNITEEQANKILDAAFNESKNNAIDNLEKMDNISEAQKKEIALKVKEATKTDGNEGAIDENLKKLVDQARSADHVLADAKNTVENLPNLNDAQKATLDAKLSQTNSEDAQSVIDQAQALDDTMKDLKDYLNNLPVGLKEEPQTDVSFTQADADKQNEFLDQSSKVKKAIDPQKGASLTKEEANELLNDFKAAKDALNGNEKLNNQKDSAKEVLNDADNIPQPKKDEFKKQIENAISEEEVNNTKKDINNFEAKMKELNDIVAKYDEVRKQIDYTGAERPKRTSYDDAIDAAREFLTNPNANMTESEVDMHLKAITDAFNALDGEETVKQKVKEITAYINSLEHLNQNQKEALIRETTLNTDYDRFEPIKNKATAVDKIMEQIKKEFDKHTEGDNPTVNNQNYLLASSDKKNAYDEALRNADLVLDTGRLGNNEQNLDALNKVLEELKGTRAALDGTQVLQEAKDTAKQSISNLSNLTQSQKDEAIRALEEAQTPQDAQNATDNAKKADQSTKELKETLSNNDLEKLQDTVDYQNADQSRKDDLKNAIENANELINKANSGEAINPALIEDAKNKVNDARDALNGIINVDKNQRDAIKQIETLPYLTPQQKQDFNDQIRNLTNAKQMEDIIENAKELNDKMKDLQEALEKANQTKNSVDYKNASDSSQESFDNAIDKVSETLSNQDQRNNPDKIQELIDNLNQDLNKLDGDERLEAKKQDARDLINNKENLNDNQKQALLDKVDELTSNDAVQEIEDNANILDEKMGELKDLVKTNPINDENKSSKIDYNEADQDKKNNFDQASNDAKDQVSDNANLDPQNVEDLINRLKESTKELNGEEKREDTIKKLQELTDNKDQVEKTHDYQNSSDEEKQTYNDAVDKARELLDNRDSTPLKDLEKALNDLKEAKKVVNPTLEDALNEIDNKANLSDKEKEILKERAKNQAPSNDLREVIAKAKEVDEEKQESIDKVDALDNLDPIQKDHFKNQIKNSDLLPENNNQAQDDQNLDTDPVSQNDEIAKAFNKAQEANEKIKEIEKAINDLVRDDQNADTQDRQTIKDRTNNLIKDLSDENLPNVEKLAKIVEKVNANDKVKELLDKYLNSEYGTKESQDLKKELEAEIARAKVTDSNRVDNATESEQLIIDKLHQELEKNIKKAEITDQIIDTIKNADGESFKQIIDQYNRNDDSKELENFANKAQEGKLFDLINKINKNEPLTKAEKAILTEIVKDEKLPNIVKTVIKDMAKDLVDFEIDVITPHIIATVIASILALLSGLGLYFTKRK